MLPPYLKAKSCSYDVLVGSNDGDILQDDGVFALKYLPLLREQSEALVRLYTVLVEAGVLGPNTTGRGF